MMIPLNRSKLFLNMRFYLFFLLLKSKQYLLSLDHSLTEIFNLLSSRALQRLIFSYLDQFNKLVAVTLALEHARVLFLNCTCQIGLSFLQLLDFTLEFLKIFLILVRRFRFQGSKDSSFVLCICFE
jgi:hypothetical protein